MGAIALLLLGCDVQPFYAEYQPKNVTYVSDVAPLGDGYAIVGTVADSVLGDHSAYLAYVTENGEVVWEKSFGEDHPFVGGQHVRPAGGDGAVAFGTAGQIYGTSYPWLSQMTESGEKVRLKIDEDQADMSIHDLVALEGGGFLAVGAIGGLIGPKTAFVATVDDDLDIEEVEKLHNWPTSTLNRIIRNGDRGFLAVGSCAYDPEEEFGDSTARLIAVEVDLEGSVESSKELESVQATGMVNGLCSLDDGYALLTSEMTRGSCDPVVVFLDSDLSATGSVLLGVAGQLEYPRDLVQMGDDLLAVGSRFSPNQDGSSVAVYEVPAEESGRVACHEYGVDSDYYWTVSGAVSLGSGLAVVGQRSSSDDESGSHEGFLLVLDGNLNADSRLLSN